jgi:competence protein ComEA
MRFGRERAPPRAQGRLMAVALLLVAAAMGVRWFADRPVSVDPVVVVEVRGDVPRPGFYAVPPPGLLHAAIAAAGGEPGERVDKAIGAGMRVLVNRAEITVSPMDSRLVFGLPIDANTASVRALETIPGIGPTRAKAIVLHRKQNGNFQSLDDLVHVKGIGPKTVAKLRSFVVTNPVMANH